MSIPKPASTRARRNRTATAATLRAVLNPTIPDLPPGYDWHERTRAWWMDVWSSPMAPEYDSSDAHGLYVMALLLNQMWDEGAKPTGRVNTAAEIRLWVAEYGLSPIARRRLQWEIDRGDEAVERTGKRREARAQGRRDQGGVDPRSILGA